LEVIGEARLVLLGEASHGTHEFYRERARITRWQLLELRQNATNYAQRDGRVAADEFFAAEQNARVVKNAERYYRIMFRGRDESWNVRDRHMAETVDGLLAYFSGRRFP